MIFLSDFSTLINLPGKDNRPGNIKSTHCRRLFFLSKRRLFFFSPSDTKASLPEPKKLFIW